MRHSRTIVSSPPEAKKRCCASALNATAFTHPVWCFKTFWWEKPWRNRWWRGDRWDILLRRTFSRARGYTAKCLAHSGLINGQSLLPSMSSFFSFLKMVATGEEDGEAPADPATYGVSYVTPRIIAMGFPSSGDSLLGIPTIDRVTTLLQRAHRGRFMVWNFSEQPYDYAKFDDQVIEFKFPGTVLLPQGGAAHSHALTLQRSCPRLGNGLHGHRLPGTDAPSNVQHL